MMKSKKMLWRGLAGMLVAGTTLAAEPLHVGVYDRTPGANPMAKGLTGISGLKVNSFQDLILEALREYDVIVFGAGAVTRPDHIRAIRMLMACGGGVVFHHTSCGRGAPATMFPSVARKVMDRREDTMMRVKDTAHPVTAGLPAVFAHGYYDHLYLDPGTQGTVLVEDRAGAAVVVAGEADGGRVVFNGAYPGYAYDPQAFEVKKIKVDGAEALLLANSVRWAGAGRPSRLGGAERKKLEQGTEARLKLQDQEALTPTAGWFGTEMLTGHYLVLPPVTELGGRFFITYDSRVWGKGKLASVKNEAERDIILNRMKADVTQLKRLGVTDLIYWCDVAGADRIYHDTKLSSTVAYRGFDPLAELIRIATAEKLNVWVAWHSTMKMGGEKTDAFARQYCAKDMDGRFYKYGQNAYCEDLLSPAYFDRCCRLLDEYAEKYKPMGNFMGLATYDEIHKASDDFHGDDLAVFGRFCEERFGEKLPADMGQRLALGRQWKPASDVWRRRYILFKQSVITDFHSRLFGYAHQKGLKIGLGLVSPSSFSANRWYTGMDSLALLRLGADMHIAVTTEDPVSAWPNTMRWAHRYQTWGFYNTHCFRGGPGGIYWTFDELRHPLMLGNTPALTREVARHIHNQRQWAGAEVLAHVGVLHNPNALLMLLDDPRVQVNRDYALFNAIQRSQDADFVFTQANERHGAYRVLVATPFAVRGLSEGEWGALKRYVESGGIVVSVAADWTVARPDLTKERDVTEEMVGVRYGKPVTAGTRTFSDGDTNVEVSAVTLCREVSVTPGTRVRNAFTNGNAAITEKKMGNGMVIGVHFAADAELEKGGNAGMPLCLNRLLQDAARPEIVVEGDGVRVVSALKKGNWVAVALYADTVPREALVKMDVNSLGIGKTAFRMLMLGKRLEIACPGDPEASGFWCARDLRAGFHVTVTADNDLDKPLPDRFDLSGFKPSESELLQSTVDGVRTTWDDPRYGRVRRNYAHEIVVLAPADEPVIPPPSDTVAQR